MSKADRNSKTRKDSKSPQPASRIPRHPLLQFISQISKDQHSTFSQLSQKCALLQNSMGNIEQYLSLLSEKLGSVNKAKESDMLGSLKMKQYEFIIGELKNTLSKQTRKEERLLEDLENEKKKTEKYREEAFKQEAKNNSFSEKIANLENKINEKNKELASLTHTLHSNKSEQDRESEHRNKSNHSPPNSPPIHATEQYLELEQKLQQLQRQFNSEMDKMANKTSQLNLELKKRQQECEQLKTSNKQQKKQVEDLRIGKYELDIKLKQQVSLYNELEQTNNKLIEKTNANEILLHKQIQDYKTKETEYKNEYKKEKRNFRLVLSFIAEMVNGNNKYYLTSHSIKEQVEEIRKLHEKNMKKKVENYVRETEFYQAECLKLKTKIEQKQAKSQQTESAGSKLTRTESHREKQSENDHTDKNHEGSFISRSVDKSEQEKYRGVQEKYLNKLQALRKDIKLKQNKINELQKTQQTEFDHSKEKILELELAISQKINEIRKYELKAKQKQYEISELRNNLKEIENKIVALNEKTEHEKDTNNKNYQNKIQTYEEKLKTLKTAYKELEKKEQEKTIKYNKLKNKSEKYEIEASESLKRKNLQIDQLLKENNKAKIQNKLLEEKININHIIEHQVNKNNPNHQTLIDQFEIETDRINTALTDKQNLCNELNEINTKLNHEQTALKRQVCELRAKLDDLTRNERVLHQQNRFAKQKIEQLSKANNSDNEDRHSYFKKELQKTAIHIKKLEQLHSKLTEQKQTIKKQLQDTQNQLTSLKANFDKLRDKNNKMSNEMLDLKESNKKAAVDYERRLSECATKEEQLITIINYKNRESQTLRNSMIGEEPEEEEQKIMFSQHTNTEPKELRQAETNTDPVSFQQNQSQAKEDEQRIIPSELIFDEVNENEHFQQIQTKEREPAALQNNEPDKGVNYFSDLIMSENMDDHFEICEEGEEINIGQTAINLQIKDVFNALRRQIEKVFNEQDISISNLRALPKQLEDDFNEFLVYIREKIVEIKNENNLSFIMVEAGNEPSIADIELELHEFITKDTKEYVKLRKIIEEKESLISSLMNEKTEQENTINQLTVEKEQVEEENENRFMNQCNVYKREIKEHKKLIDLLEMSCQSLKNIFKNMLEIWVAEGDNEDDLRDNLVLYANICKLTDTEKKRIAVYLSNYKEFKKIR